MLSKRGPVTIQYDKNGLAVRKLDYTIKLVNKLDTPLTDIEFIEDVANTDNRLFMTALTGNLVAVGQRVGLSMTRLRSVATRQTAATTSFLPGRTVQTGFTVLT